MKDRTILVSALIACSIHALILFSNIGMTPPALVSEAASIEVDLVATPLAPAPQPAPPAPMPAEPAVKPEPLPEPEPVPEPIIEPVPEPVPIPEPKPEPIPEPVPEPEVIPEPLPEPEPETVIEVPHETAVVEHPAATAIAPSVEPDSVETAAEKTIPIAVDDAGETGASTEKVELTFDHAPGYTYNPKPRYPRAARRRGQQGTVMLLVEVLANGRVGEIEIEESSGHKLLDDAAVQAVRRWRFVPAKKASVSVVARVRIPVEFNLEGEQ